MVVWSFTPNLKKRVLMIALIGIALIGMYYFVISPALRPKSLHSDYSFELSVGTSEAVHNVTLIVPIPARNGRPEIGTTLLTEEMFKKTGYNATFITKDDNVYVKITADTILPGKENMYRVNLFSYRDAEGLSDLANTRYPLGNESVFTPKDNTTIERPIPASYPTWYGMHHNPITSSYETDVYAAYNSSDTAIVDISAEISVRNEWVESGTRQGNSYRDNYAKILHGNAQGWYLANGKFETGGGKYFDMG